MYRGPNLFHSTTIMMVCTFSFFQGSAQIISSCIIWPPMSSIIPVAVHRDKSFMNRVYRNEQLFSRCTQPHGASHVVFKLSAAWDLWPISLCLFAQIGLADLALGRTISQGEALGAAVCDFSLSQVNPTQTQSTQSAWILVQYFVGGAVSVLTLLHQLVQIHTKSV